MQLTFSYSTQNKNARFLNNPVGVEEEALQKWEKVRQEVVAENIGQNVKSCSRTLP